jgi:hypothetical protein
MTTRHHDGTSADALEDDGLAGVPAYLTLRTEVENGTRSESQPVLGSFAQLVIDKGLAHERKCLAEFTRAKRRCSGRVARFLRRRDMRWVPVTTWRRPMVSRCGSWSCPWNPAAATRPISTSTLHSGPATSRPPGRSRSGIAIPT